MNFKKKCLVAGLMLTLSAAGFSGLALSRNARVAKADEVIHSGTVYVDTYSNYNHDVDNWEKDNAKIAVYYTNDVKNYWTDYMTPVDGVSHLFKASYSLDFTPTKVIAVRLNPNAEKGWDAKWNQTPDLEFRKNEIIQIQDDNDDWGSVYGVDNWYVKGTMNSWSEDPAYKLSIRRNGDGRIDYYSTSIVMDAGDEFKIYNDSYDNSTYGYNTLRTYQGKSAKEKGDVTGAGSSNVTVVTAGTYEVYVDTNETLPIWVQLDSESEATAYANKFLNAMTCDDEGESEPTLSIDWALLKSDFNALTDGAQDLLKAGTKNAKIVEFAQRYRLVVKNHGYENFMGISLSNMPLTSVHANTNIVIIIVISSIAVLSIAGLFLIRRRKEEK